MEAMPPNRSAPPSTTAELLQIVRLVTHHIGAGVAGEVDARSDADHQSLQHEQAHGEAIDIDARADGRLPR